MAKEKRFSNDISIKNRKASFEYEWLEQFEAGIVLKGTEIKSIREGKISLSGAYCYLHNDELFIKGMNITPYTESSFQNHDPMRERKMLLKKSELKKLKAKTEEKGLTIIPTKLFVNKRGYAKVGIALARGKKLFDKRDTLKKKDQDREMKRLKI
ncbi:MAG: SsrA-binding protein SmpB [Cyclobacteriaceae bacterium]|tara:strand:- start:5483 stop:5947 length:465 start_codon:yes stop_codon:yes gene_type:complete